jgi:hypothetical protein
MNLCCIEKEDKEEKTTTVIGYFTIRDIVYHSEILID